MAYVRGADRPDVAAGVLGVAAVLEASAFLDPNGSSVAFVLALAVTLPIALVRHLPAAAAALLATACFLSVAAQVRPPVAGLLALGIAYYLVGRRGSKVTAILLVAPFVAYAMPPGDRLYAISLLVATAPAMTVGIAQHTRGLALHRRATERATADTLLEHAARGERARIARELHDVVAHHISMIALQADAVRLTTPEITSEGASRLIAMGDTARTALTEMRRLLGVLREDAGIEQAPRRPQPGLQQLNELLDKARPFGGTRLIVHGRVATLDPGIELTAYRIVQEALTNARRHAAGAAVDVVLHYQPDVLRVQIRDNGPGPMGVLLGHGLTGMQERVAAVGGKLSCGQGPLGGFVVEALLPTVSLR